MDLTKYTNTVLLSPSLNEDTVPSVQNMVWKYEFSVVRKYHS